MSRIKGRYAPRPGMNSDLSEEAINSESDWHNAFERRMESAGWTVKHEVVRNDGKERADFLCYHDDLNRSYDQGEWFGFELKYSDYKQETRAASAAKQIEQKYSDGSWLSSGEEVAVWVVAPYVESSHTGSATEMREARSREIEAAAFLERIGFGYLNSWHPAPHISIDKQTDKRPFPVMDGWVNTPGVPAFSGVFDSWKHSHILDYEAEIQADRCRVYRGSDGVFDYDREELVAVEDSYGCNGVGQ